MRLFAFVPPVSVALNEFSRRFAFSRTLCPTHHPSRLLFSYIRAHPEGLFDSPAVRMVRTLDDLDPARSLRGMNATVLSQWEAGQIPASLFDPPPIPPYLPPVAGWCGIIDPPLSRRPNGRLEKGAIANWADDLLTAFLMSHPQGTMWGAHIRRVLHFESVLIFPLLSPSRRGPATQILLPYSDNFQDIISAAAIAVLQFVNEIDYDDPNTPTLVVCSRRSLLSRLSSYPKYGARHSHARLALYDSQVRQARHVFLASPPPGRQASEFAAFKGLRSLSGDRDISVALPTRFEPSPREMAQSARLLAQDEWWEFERPLLESSEWAARLGLAHPVFTRSPAIPLTYAASHFALISSLSAARVELIDKLSSTSSSPVPSSLPDLVEISLTSRAVGLISAPSSTRPATLTPFFPLSGEPVWAPHTIPFGRYGTMFYDDSTADIIAANSIYYGNPAAPSGPIRRFCSLPWNIPPRPVTAVVEDVKSEPDLESNWFL
ncbi:hypothetical protein BOTBODRAFT_179754 [Botryobasidium botryosum FD-172 SS1]|uniref:Uncharacterized protein n=1 Tax=Botryobasidium botryosum (strain FD-172 SS1) TaxID=930990 RepID=A0A067LZ53_BOTB1|nr:hypothetical protein BOTBODRAFT_179754 [Botryobasidium botryosum FD-172 SS1]